MDPFVFKNAIQLYKNRNVSDSQNKQNDEVGSMRSGRQIDWIELAPRKNGSEKIIGIRLKTTPSCSFGWNWSNGNKKEDKPQIKYHDIVLPFPLSLVDKTFLKRKELKCCYKATLDGFSATDFHKCCDFKGPCVIIGYTDKSFKFGAFNPEGYRSTDDYYDTFDAFLFYWEENEGADPIILPKVGGSGAALFDYARGGPQFGADGLLIGPPLAPVMGGFAGPDTNSGVGDLRQARSRLGLSYAKRKDGKDSIFGDENRAVVAEVQVFCSPQIASLY